MLDYNMALDIVNKYLKKEDIAANKGSIPISSIVIESETIEKDYGWIFFYNSKEFIETGDWSQMLVGNAPLIVERETGRIIPTGTAHQVDYYLKIYEERGNLDGVI